MVPEKACARETGTSLVLADIFWAKPFGRTTELLAPSSTAKMYNRAVLREELRRNSPSSMRSRRWVTANRL